MNRPNAKDDGLFGPGSMAWRIHADPSAWLGGGRALLIQALHPTTMAVFDQNTSYREDPWGRLRRTAAYFGATIFGDTATAERAAERLRSVHARVRGVDPEAGRQWRADDPELLLWVHATAVHSFVAAYRRFAHRLPDGDADRYVAEMVRHAELVGLEAADVPATLADLRAYLKGVEGLRATPSARDGMRMILFRPPVPLALYPPWSIISTALISLLPRRLRALYGLPWVPIADPPVRAAVFALTRAFNVLVPRIPPVRDALRRSLTAA